MDRVGAASAAASRAAPAWTAWSAWTAPGPGPGPTGPWSWCPSSPWAWALPLVPAEAGRSSSASAIRSSGTVPGMALARMIIRAVAWEGATAVITPALPAVRWYQSDSVSLSVVLQHWLPVQRSGKPPPATGSACDHLSLLTPPNHTPRFSAKNAKIDLRPTVGQASGRTAPRVVPPLDRSSAATLRRSPCALRYRATTLAQPTQQE